MSEGETCSRGAAAMNAALAASLKGMPHSFNKTAGQGPAGAAGGAGERSGVATVSLVGVGGISPIPRGSSGAKEEEVVEGVLRVVGEFDAPPPLVSKGVVMESAGDDLLGSDLLEEELEEATAIWRTKGGAKMDDAALAGGGADEAIAAATLGFALYRVPRLKVVLEGADLMISLIFIDARPKMYFWKGAFMAISLQ